jgi:malate dehydrogenase (quinone)
VEQRGHGHAALCELNYMPAADPAKAISINEQFQQSRELWSSLVARACSTRRRLHQRDAAHDVRAGREGRRLPQGPLRDPPEQPLFATIEYSEDSRVINQWAPLLMQAPQG